MDSGLQSSFMLASLWCWKAVKLYTRYRQYYLYNSVSIHLTNSGYFNCSTYLSSVPLFVEQKQIFYEYSGEEPREITGSLSNPYITPSTNILLCSNDKDQLRSHPDFGYFQAWRLNNCYRQHVPVVFGHHLVTLKKKKKKVFP